MIDWFFLASLWFNVGVGVLVVGAGLVGRPPHNLMALGLAVTEFLLLAQLVLTTVLVAQGQSAARDTVEFYAYLITALLVPLGAVLWALLDRANRWSSVVLGVAALTVAIMLVRMHQIWTGDYTL